MKSVTGDHDPFPVYTLLGADNLEFSLTCLRSVADMTREPLEFHILDDGTLGPAECDRLRGALPVAKILDRPTRDAAVAPVLAEFPHWRHFRENYPIAMKMDMLILAEGPFTYLDSDIYFIRPFTGLDPRKMPGDIAFMRNAPYNLNFDGHKLWPKGKVQMAKCVNGGVIVCRRKPVQWENIDKWLAMPENDLSRKKQGTMEQETWAYIVEKELDFRQIDRRQMIFPKDEWLPLRGIVAMHFTRVLRQNFETIRGRVPYEANRKRKPVALRFRPGERMTSRGYESHQVRQKFKKRVEEPIQRRLKPVRRLLRQAGL